MIPRQNGSLKLGEEKHWEYKYGHTRDWGVTCTSICRLALHCVLGWFPHSLQGGPGDNGSSTLAKRAPGRLLPPSCPCCVPRKELRSCWQHLWYWWAMAISKGIFWYSREEKVKVFHMICDSLVMPSSLWPSKSNDGSSWPPPSTLGKAAGVF